MNINRKHKAIISARLQKSRALFVLLLFMIFLSILSFTPNPIDTGTYNLVYPANFGNRISIPADNPTTKQGVYLGRMLFYETKLSANNTLSCGSCHQQNKAFTDGLAFSKGVDGVLTPRNSMSLVNLLWARKFFWDGRATGLEEQATTPLTNPHEMGQALAISAQKLSQTSIYPPLFKLVYGDNEITGERIVKAVSQFERTLISANSRYDRYLRGTYQPTADELKGMELFNNAPQPEKGIRGANCGHCHGGPKTYMELFHNNGLDSIPKDAGIAALTGSPADKGRFKVPTLRNIALTAPYMHDGRFKTLAEVVDHYSDHILESASLSSFLRGESNEVGGKSLKLQPLEKKQIIAFLNMLTDSTFINNPEFADPNLLTAKNQHH
ncbi:MAG: cytochrome c peroxidase [Mucilaginibacter sp.]|uniref:cytochrome-c peroxidase n=1 Tax=Mucilaginibacter sp. TaxID=1882438 RepID=UPI0031A44D95